LGTSICQFSRSTLSRSGVKEQIVEIVNLKKKKGKKR
jgi:hypothetical protein